MTKSFLWLATLILLISQVVSVPIPGLNEEAEGPENSTEDASDLQLSDSNPNVALENKEQPGDEQNIVHDNNDAQDDDYDDDDDEDFCVICHDDFREEEPLDLTCGHKYHSHCLRDYQKTIIRMTKCFLCKQEFQIKGMSLHLADYFYKQLMDETAEIKLKMGIMASSLVLPQHWLRLPMDCVDFE